MKNIHPLIFICAVLLSNYAFADPLQMTINASKAVDLTQPLYNGMPFWPGTEPIKIERLADYDQGYRMHKFTMWENIGTHVDSPSHFAAGKGKRTIDQLPLDQLIVPIVVINVQNKVTSNDDYLLTVNDITEWEAHHGKIEKGCLLVMNTGWYKKFSNPTAYVNQDKEGVLHFPGFSTAVAELLINRDVAGIGIDTLSLDPGNDLSFPVHNVMLAANKYQVENLNNLDALPETGAVVVIGVLPVRDGSQAQARVIGLME
ncbi:MAG: kynurenine formamidase [Planctomycetota bacterium]|jgi:kynurenine formamidase